MSTRWSARCLPPKASPVSRKWRSSIRAKSPRSTASTRIPPSEIQTRAREYLEKIEAEHDEKRTRARRCGRTARNSGRHDSDAGHARRGRRKDRRGFCRLCSRRSRRLERAQGRRDEILPRRAGQPCRFPRPMPNRWFWRRASRRDGSPKTSLPTKNPRPLTRPVRDVSRTGDRIGRDERSHLHRYAPTSEPDELIRFVVGPDACCRSGYQEKSSRPRLLGDCRPRPRRQGGRQGFLRKRLQEGCRRSAGAWRMVDTCSQNRRLAHLVWRARPGPWR